jgi:hypothetical protein
MCAQQVSFSILGHAQWAPGIETPEAWLQWAQAPFNIAASNDPAVLQMPAMLRRRAGFVGKMALEVAYQCMDGRRDIPTVFCSRHGDVSRAVGLLTDLAEQTPLSPMGFGLAVHNASAGLFSIARTDQANHLALAAGMSTIEHAIIEACSLLADGAPLVLLVAYDNRLPELFSQFKDCAEQPHAWAWLMAPAQLNPVHLSWTTAETQDVPETPDCIATTAAETLPAGLEILRFFLLNETSLVRVAERRRWHWTRDV